MLKSFSFMKSVCSFWVLIYILVTPIYNDMVMFSSRQFSQGMKQFIHKNVE